MPCLFGCYCFSKRKAFAQVKAKKAKSKAKAKGESKAARSAPPKPVPGGSLPKPVKDPAAVVAKAKAKSKPKKRRKKKDGVASEGEEASDEEDRLYDEESHGGFDTSDMESSDDEAKPRVKVAPLERHVQAVEVSSLDLDKYHKIDIPVKKIGAKHLPEDPTLEDIEKVHQKRIRNMQPKTFFKRSRGWPGTVLCI